SGEQRILGERHARRGRMTKPLLWHEGRTEPASLRHRKPPRCLAIDDDRAVTRSEPLARECGEQLVLAVARNSRHAKDLAAADLDRNFIKPDPMRVFRHHGEVAHHEARLADALAGRALYLADLATDHHAGERACRLAARITGRDLLAGAQDRRGVTQALHLIELVADVEDRAAFRFEALQHNK